MLFSELHTRVVLLSMSRTSHTLDYSSGKVGSTAASQMLL